MKIPKAQKLPSGNWRVQLMVDGRRVSITGKTKQEAERQAAAVKSGAAVQKEQHKRITLSDAISEYIEAGTAPLSPSTLRGYATIRRNRFQDLMSRDIYGITKEDVQRSVNSESAKVSAKTVSNAYGLIRPVLKKYGIDVFGVHLPQIRKPIKHYLQPEDIGKLIEVIRGDSCEIPILLAVWLGMRRSEIIGLCWDCVDTENRILYIRRAVVPDQENHWVLKDTAKNLSSQRAVSCPAYIMDKIKQLPRRNDNRLFSMHPDTVRKHIHRACAAAGITDTTVHGLRHTNAAVMKTIGIDDRHAMARGGWSCESTYKKTYSYVFDEKASAADLEIDRFFESLGKEEE